MPITDLTNTKWFFNSTIDISTDREFYVNFTTENLSHDEISIESGTLYYISNSYGETTTAYSSGSWSEQEDCRTIHIIDGDDVENTALITWLQANATQLLTNLTGTKWIINNKLPNRAFPSSNVAGPYYINFNTGEDLEYVSDFIVIYPEQRIEYDQISTSSGYVYNDDGVNTWEDDLYRVIDIIDGDDVENTELIEWLETYASLITFNSDRLSHSVWEFKDYNDGQYDIMSYLYNENGEYTISGLFRYENEKFNVLEKDGSTLWFGNTRVATTSAWEGNDTKLVVDAINNNADIDNLLALLNRCAIFKGWSYKLGWRVRPATQSHQVTFTASGNWYGNDNDSNVYIYDGTDNTGTLLLHQNPANKSAFPMTLTITSGYCYISVTGAFVGYYQGITSSDYTLTGDYAMEKVATIDKDGTIDIEVKDFDD